MKDKYLMALKNIVAVSYELTAEHFDATRSKVAAHDFLWAANQIGSDDKVFDAGCGNGRLLNYINIDPDNYLGFDQSSALIALAKKHHPLFNFLSGDLADLSTCPHDSFSIIFCSAAISHIPGRRERRAVLKALLALCAPNGHLIISFWKITGRNRRRLYMTWLKKIVGSHIYGWRDLIFPWKSAAGKEVVLRYYYAFSCLGFQREIRRAGWQIEAVRNDKFNYWVIARKTKGTN
jgi:SAM-dependent methyltransferase